MLLRLVETDGLLATIDLRCREVGLEDAEVLPGATIRRVDPGARTIAQGLADPPDDAAAWAAGSATLPRISFAAGPEGLGEAVGGASTSSHPPDLLVVRTLGEGGMGLVRLARQHSLAREVAVKTLRPDAPSRARQALMSEALVTGSLEHPGIIPVHALGIDQEERPVLVMKRVEGVEWSALIHEPEHAAWQWLPGTGDRLAAHLDILMQICNAVHFAHSKAVIHHDIKPDNVMIGRFGEVYLVDWGIAGRAGEAQGQLAGTPGYMAPEMVRGGVVDARTDVYLLGATLHEVLTGHLRHAGTHLPAILLAALRSAPVSYAADVPAELAKLCNAATNPDPDARPLSAMAFRKALVRFLEHRGSVALEATAAERLAQLEQLLQENGEGEPHADAARVQRLMSEAHFGFRQALHAWPESPGAAAGLERCLCTMADVALRQGNAQGARGLLEEAANPPRILRERLDRLERSIADRRERDDRLERLEHDMDAHVGASSRARAAVALVLMAVLVMAYLFSGNELNATQAVYIAAGLLLVTSVWIALGRKSLLSTAFNRRMAALMWISVAALLVNRLISLADGSSIEDLLIRDHVLFAALTLVGGALLLRTLLWMGLLFLAGLVASIFDRSLGPATFSLATILGSAWVAYRWSRPGKPDTESKTANGHGS